MVSSHELGIEVESLAHENNPDPPFLPESQPSSYEKEKTVEPSAPTEDSGKDDIIFSGEWEIISKEQVCLKHCSNNPKARKIQNDSKIPDYVRQNNAEAMSLLKMDFNHKIRKKTNKKHRTFEAAKDSRDKADEVMNVEVGHIDNQPPHTGSSPILNETIHDETPPASPQNIQAFQERETMKPDTMGQDMTDIIPDPEQEMSSSANFQGIFLSCMEEFGDILNYHSNITQQ
ncbi:hypothetical protein O181_069823 [Austropuccinia psidii MF-1]|uniref:Uncharacterized protein n=1 Tax=Austropuccinia psidii MF-1 TaxID=1389203 RepID=A0A9Q3I6Q1_9BASI|nr:hypothetical protein [Austropuccinia psidii MF-1]